MGLFSSLFGKKGSPAEPAPAEPAAAEPESGIDLAEALQSADGALRVDVVRSLLERWREGELAAAESLAPRLPELLEDGEPLVRLAALAGVRLLRNPENLAKCESGVLALLADRVPQVRTAAVVAAVRIPGETARTQVRAALQSDEESMRFVAACALSDVGDAAALPELIAALADEHRRQEALSAVMALGDPGAVAEVEKLFEQESLGDFDRTMAAATLARLGDARGGAHLVSRLESDGDDRPIAAEWAGRLGVQEAIPALTEVAEADGDLAQGAAIRALGRLKAPGAEDRLLRLAGDGAAPEDLRMDAAEGLAELGTPGAIDLLRSLAAEGPGELRQLCQELLAEVQPNAG
jgi:HEAT repeat protein